MKKTIKSKRYNTATAKTLYRWTNGANPDEHSYREESLCVGTRNKVIFLYTSTGVKGQSEDALYRSQENPPSSGYESMFPLRVLSPTR